MQRALAYARQLDIRLEDRLGFGKDGIVWSTEKPSVVKVFEKDYRWQRELDVYRRLESLNMRSIRGHQIPVFLGADKEYLAIHMTLVRRPFLLDFATAQLDAPLEFPPEVLEEWERDKAEQFGANWTEAKSVLAALEGRCGIYMLDVHPGNIGFRDC